MASERKTLGLCSVRPWKSCACLMVAGLQRREGWSSDASSRFLGAGDSAGLIQPLISLAKVWFRPYIDLFLKFKSNKNRRSPA